MAPVNSVRVTAVTEPTINFFAFILLLSAPSPLAKAISVHYMRRDREANTFVLAFPPVKKLRPRPPL
jgi:hypothetical protein